MVMLIKSDGDESMQTGRGGAVVGKPLQFFLVTFLRLNKIESPKYLPDYSVIVEHLAPLILHSNLALRDANWE